MHLTGSGFYYSAACGTFNLLLAVWCSAMVMMVGFEVAELCHSWISNRIWVVVITAKSPDHIDDPLAISFLQNYTPAIRHVRVDYMSKVLSCNHIINLFPRSITCI